MSLQDEISLAIQNHMPAAVGEELKKFISKAQETERLLVGAQEQIVDLKATRDRQSKQLVAQTDLDSREQLLKQGQDELVKATLQLATKSAENRAVVAEGKLATAIDMFNTVFKNPEMRKLVVENSNVAVQGGASYSGGNQNPGYIMPVTNTSTITETQA